MRLALLVVVAMPGMALACSPPAPTLDAGFYRDDVTRLPRNARGVMFFLPSAKAAAADFRLTSPDDKRPLALRLHTFRDRGTIRLEPAGGFVPKARYTFEYLPAHEAWRFPDRMSVTIDETVVDTAGRYAIEPAPRPEVRMIVVPGSPACIEPAVAVAQPFSYRVPAGLAPYRTALEYGTAVHLPPRRGADQQGPRLRGWPFEPASYHADILWHERGIIAAPYTAADDAIVAACDQKPLRAQSHAQSHAQLQAQLRGTVAFPEVDDTVHRVAPVRIDLGRNVLGECRPLDALTRTMQVYGAAKALEAVCGRTLAYDPADADGGDPTARWERSLAFLFDLSPTCTLAALAEAVRTRQYVPDNKATARLGAALAEGVRSSRASWRVDDASAHQPVSSDPVFRQSIDGLDRLVRHLPADLQPRASGMLAPLLPELGAQLAEPMPYRPDLLAALIIRVGSLPADVRARILWVARGRTAAAPHARAILSALPVQDARGRAGPTPASTSESTRFGR